MKKQQAEYDILKVAHDAGKEELQSVLQELDNVKNQTAKDNEVHKQRLKKQFSLLENVVENFNTASDSLVQMIA